jgi:hypothetical protein
VCERGVEAEQQRELDATALPQRCSLDPLDRGVGAESAVERFRLHLRGHCQHAGIPDPALTGLPEHLAVHSIEELAEEVGVVLHHHLTNS